MQWMPAVGAGLIAGIILLVIPRGTPWSAITFFVPTVMGRVIPMEWGVGFVAAMLMHLSLSMLYGIVVARVTANITQLRAVIVGGVVGLILYLVNLGVVSMWFPELRLNEVSVAFSHMVFGLIAGGAYRGLLRRRAASVPLGS